MPPSNKRPTGQSSKQTTERPVESSSPSSKPSLRFYYSNSLHAQTLAVLTAVEQSQDGTQHRDALSDIVMELASSGMEYYYLRPLKLAKVNSVLERSARMGIGGVLWVMSPVIRKVIGRMDRDQLLAVCIHIRQLME